MIHQVTATSVVIWLGQADPPEPLQRLAAARNAKIVRLADCTRVLGTVVGDAATTAAAAHQQLMTCVADATMPLQMYVLLMRMVLGPSVVHMLHVSPGRDGRGGQPKTCSPSLSCLDMSGCPRASNF
jgi:hypothetical protein